MSVLCYHAVEDGWPSPMAVEPAQFQRHCDWLSRHRTVLPLAVALSLMDRRGRLPRRTTALTFDDGFSSLHAEVLPRLVAHGFPATVFLVAETLTERGRPVDWVATPAPYPMTTLTLDQVLEMRDAGVDMQSHSWAHHDLTALTYAECVADLTRSRELLGDLLGAPVSQLAYPRGRHDEQVRRAAEAAGYDYAVALPEAREAFGRYAVPRVGVHRGNSVRTLMVKEAPQYLQLRTSPAYARAKALAGRH